MNIEELKETEPWELYKKGENYANLQNRYFLVNRNIRFYNGDQSDGLKIKSIEPVSLNFIKPVLKFKVGIVNESNRALKFNADNVDNIEHRQDAKNICDLLNTRIARLYENNQMDFKFKKFALECAITGESVGYVYHDDQSNNEVTDILSTLDIYYSDETSDDIQRQAYILIKQRLTVIEAQELARKNNVPEENIKLIMGDNETENEAGADSQEFDDKVTVVVKFYKKDNVVHFERATRYVIINEDTSTGLSLYPLFHMNWEDKIGSARGIGEVEPLVYNQLEVNKTLMRRSYVAKSIAYPQKIYNMSKITNPDAINQVGGIIKAKGEDLDDVSKVFQITRPMQMSPDVAQLQQELINTSRELANASNAATGQVNPTEASGKAILAVQRASEQPLNDQVNSFNKAIEDYGRILFDFITTYYNDGLTLEKIENDPLTNEESITRKKVTATQLKNLKASISVDVTPKSAYDKYAQEISLENLAANQNFMNNSWLKDYVSLLDNDSVMPKIKLEDLIRKREANLQKIQEMQSQGMALQQATQQALNSNAILPKEMAQYNPNDVDQISNLQPQNQQA